MGAGAIYLALSKGLCRECHQLVEARYVSEDDHVFLERHCPEHGKSRALVAESFAWYLAALAAPVAADPPPRTIPRTGDCPSSCGPCEMHGQRCHLPVFSITNACDLRCPICFTYNRADRTWFMGDEEFARCLDSVVEATGGVDLVNVTGGEPTLHPRLFDLLALAKRPGIGRITVNTNGLSIARDPDVARRFADAGAYVVLSLDTLDPERSVRLHGQDIVREKLLALDALERFGVGTTILMVLAGGVNEADLPAVLDLALSRDHVRSLTIQTMTYTGQGGGRFLPRAWLPVDGVERRIEEATGGRIRRTDFFPLPAAHPLCYGVAYLLLDGRGGARSLTDLLPAADLARHLRDGYFLRPGPALERDLRAAVERLWAEDREPELRSILKEMLGELYPPEEALSLAERQRRAERRVKTIYVHAHMDEDTYEIGRVMRCPDQVPVDDKRMVSACNYNLFNRQNDERFWVAP